MKVYGVWSHGGLYDPSYLMETFSTPELAEAYARLHNVPGDLHDYREMEIDPPEALALIERGVRAWCCSYWDEPNREWDIEQYLSVEADGSDEPERDATVEHYPNPFGGETYVWEVTVIAPSAEDAKKIAVERIERLRGELGEAA